MRKLLDWSEKKEKEKNIKTKTKTKVIKKYMPN